MAHSDHFGQNFWERYLNLLMDPAHILFEVTVSILFDVLIVYLGYQLFFKRLLLPRLKRDIHREIDREHEENRGIDCFLEMESLDTDRAIGDNR